ncbi:MAG: hypothetical protein ACXVCD_05145 [Pseudobdellovibrionaceae bacterium]
MNTANQVCEINCLAGGSYDRKCLTKKEPVCVQAASFEWLFRKNGGFISLKNEKLNLQEELKNKKTLSVKLVQSNTMVEKDIKRIKEKLTDPGLSEQDRKNLETQLNEFQSSLAKGIEKLKNCEDRIKSIDEFELPELETKNLEIDKDFKKAFSHLESASSLVVDKGEHLFDILASVFNQENIYLNEDTASKLYSGYCSFAYDAENCTSNSWSSDSSGPLVGFSSPQKIIDECRWSAGNMYFGAIGISLEPKDISAKPLETAPRYFKGECSVSKLNWDSMHCGYKQPRPTMKFDVFGHTTKELRMNCKEIADERGDNRSVVMTIESFNDWSL